MWFDDSLGVQDVTRSFWLIIVEDSVLLGMGGIYFPGHIYLFILFYFLSPNINLIADMSWCVKKKKKRIISCIKTCSINSRIGNENNPPKGVVICKLLNYSMKTSPSAASTGLKRCWGNYLVLSLKVSNYNLLLHNHELHHQHSAHCCMRTFSSPGEIIAGSKRNFKSKKVQRSLKLQLDKTH